MKKPRMNPMLVMESTNLLTHTAMRAARSRIVAEKYIELPLSRGRARANAEAGNMADECHHMMMPLLTRPGVWEEIEKALNGGAGGTGAAPAHAGPTPPQTCRAVLGFEVVRQALDGREPVLVHGFPVAEPLRHESDDTPLKAALDAKYVARFANLVGVYDKAGLQWTSKGATKVKVLVGGDLDAIRLEPKLLYKAASVVLAPVLRKHRVFGGAAVPQQAASAVGAATPAPSLGPATTPHSTASNSSGSVTKDGKWMHCALSKQKSQFACVMYGVDLCHAGKSADKKTCFTYFHNLLSTKFAGKYSYIEDVSAASTAAHGGASAASAGLPFGEDEGEKSVSEF